MRLTSGGQGTRRKARARPEQSQAASSNARTRAGSSGWLGAAEDLKHWGGRLQAVRGQTGTLLCPARALSEKARAGGSGREVLSTADYDEQRRPREAAKGAEKYEGNKAKACLRRLPFGYCCRLSLSPSTPLAFAL
jgi:hypothetical protein